MARRVGKVSGFGCASGVPAGLQGPCAMVRDAWASLRGRVGGAVRAARAVGKAAAREEEGQGTTEYALIVGVLVVIAIAALVTLREKVQSLWDAITGAMSTL